MSEGISSARAGGHVSAVLRAAGVLVAGAALAGCAAADPARVPSSISYRDGVYDATGWYGSLPSHQDVTLTLAAGVVTDVQITTPAEDETSLGYQQRFAQALPGEVVGRDIDDLDVDRVAGASGCSEGFMNALASIKEQAASS